MNTPQTAKHTPTPWIAHKGDEWSNIKIIAGTSQVATISPLNENANASLIIRAVNSHDELVNALRGMLELYSALVIRPGNAPAEIIAKQVLASAQGKEN